MKAGAVQCVGTEGSGVLRDLLCSAALAATVLLYFLPALLSGASLAPGDGSVSYLPNFYRADPSMWVEDIYGGYAAGLDPQFQLFYIPFWLTSTYPLFVLVAYVAAALGAFGCARSLGASRLGAFVAGLMVAFGGFMVAHLGHVTMIHAAAWIPWILWSVAATSRSQGPLPVLAGAVSTWLCIGGGHPQISLMGLFLAGFFALSLVPAQASALRMAYLGRITALFAVGLMLAGPNLAGLYAASLDSARGTWSELDFNSFSYTPDELALLLFPNIYGADSAGPFGAYAGPFNLTELAAYVGWLPWLLLPVLLVSRSLMSRTWFWLLAAFVSLLLMFGTLTPLGRLVFELPVLGQFRAQARYGIVLCISLAMASAIAITALERAEIGGRKVRNAFWIGAALLTGLAVWQSLRSWPELAVMGQAHLRLGLPLALGLATVATLWWAIQTRARAALALIPFLFLVDLGSFGWFYEWRSSPPLVQFAVQPDAKEALSEIARSGGRVLPRFGSTGPLTPLTANTNLMHRVPVVTGYGPLADPLFLNLARATTAGGIAFPPPDAAILDVLGVGWVAGEPMRAESQLIGSGCGAEGSPKAVTIPVPASARWLRVSSHLSCSTHLTNGTPVARLSGGKTAGRTPDIGVLKAGIDTAEWAHARPDVAAVVRHSRPAHATSFDAGGFPGYWFSAVIDLHGGATDEQRLLTLESVSPGSPLRVQSVEHSSDGVVWQPTIARPNHPGFDEYFSAFRHIEGLPALLRRNQMPARYWMPCVIEVVSLDSLRARLWAGGEQRIDVHKTLLVNPDIGIGEGVCRGKRTAELVEWTPGRIRLKIAPGEEHPLVLASAFHRGWQAKANDQPLPVFRAYGLNLGVIVPVGEQDVVFRFSPPELRLGFFAFAMGLLSAAFLLLIALLKQFLPKFTGART